jgi:hypothetical protein
MARSSTNYCRWYEEAKSNWETQTNISIFSSSWAPFSVKNNPNEFSQADIGLTKNVEIEIEMWRLMSGNDLDLPLKTTHRVFFHIGQDAIFFSGW